MLSKTFRQQNPTVSFPYFWTRFTRGTLQGNTSVKRHFMCGLSPRLVSIRGVLLSPLWSQSLKPLPDRNAYVKVKPDRAAASSRLHHSLGIRKSSPTFWKTSQTALSLSVSLPCHSVEKSLSGKRKGVCQYCLLAQHSVRRALLMLRTLIFVLYQSRSISSISACSCVLKEAMSAVTFHENHSPLDFA